MYLREIFLDFDPTAVSKLNEKKMVAPGSAATSLLSELKVRAIIENGRQMCKVPTLASPIELYISLLYCIKQTNMLPVLSECALFENSCLVWHANTQSLSYPSNDL